MALFLSIALALATGGGEAPRASSALREAWDARRAEHLLNRAGFGADAREIARAVELGPERLIDELLTADPWHDEPFYARVHVDRESLRALPEEERRQRERRQREEDKEQGADYLGWWIERMLAGEDPLVERMTLYWHGHFTSSFEDVKGSYEMIRQNQLFRRHALGSFRELLHGIARDPAMLVYLDNAANKKGKPNENFARELLELFTLGEGNYTEEDVREVARAFTGFGVKSGRFRFDGGRHDRGQKRVLGVEGELDGGDVLEILLRQEACARHLARRLVTHFEGREPDPARVERYAELLRREAYRIDVFLRALFLDPEFYREEVLGLRIASPIDFLVGTARRLGARPDGRLVRAAAALLGEKLFFPPSVKGWEGGRAWISAASPELPAQMAGILVGEVRARDLFGPEPARPAADELDEPAAPGAKRRLPSEMRILERLAARPRLNLTQRVGRMVEPEASDAEIAGALLELLLAVPLDPALVRQATERMEAARAELDEPDAGWLTRPEVAEPLLRALAYEVLSLPEARLH